MASSQRDEIEVLLSVYPDILTTTDVPAGLEVKLDIAIELERERVFDVVSSISDPSSPSDGIQVRLSHLPALLLAVLFPPEYPSNADPIVRSIHARHAWLAPGLVSRLGERLGERWRESVEKGTRDEGVLWPWVEDIRTGAFLDSFGSTVPFASSSSASSSTRPITLPHPAPKTLYAHLVAHESAAKQAQFSAQAFTCGICLAPQRGARCMQLPCPRTHVFCLECLKSFWGLCVSEGEVGKVACPGVECVQEREKNKDEDTVGGAEWEDAVRRVLSEEEVQRWKWLRVKQAAEKDPNTVPCPVRTCQAPVVRPKAAAEDESGHGPVTRCAVTRTAEFMEAYITLDEGGPQRRALEAQYGKKNLERMAVEYVQEKENAVWLKERTMACPGCSTSVEKSQGVSGLDGAETELIGRQDATT
ncbi:translation termination inhibitor protein itt1 [Ceratobasidium sp. 414]|nr:translation termination inhibitor protein itt1 [Ceratobasidium sp. 414]